MCAYVGDVNFLTLLSSVEKKLLQSGPSLLLVSGGPDSIFLFHFFLFLRRRYRLRFEVIHFNHGLRSTESQAEANFVKELCEKQGIVCHLRRLRLTQTGNLQNEARKRRLRACLKLQEKKRFSFFVTAHHQDDFLETLIMRASRGAGLSGMTGIRRLTPLLSTTNQSLFLCRPLLAVTKKQIINTLSQKNLKYCVDSSNLLPKYFRNRVRFFIGDHSSKISKSRLYELACHLGKIDDYLNIRISDLLEKYSQFVPKREWQAWPEEIRFRFFRHQMNQYGFEHQIERRHFALLERVPHKLVLNEAVFLEDKWGIYFTTKVKISQGPLHVLRQSLRPNCKKSPLKK